VIHALKKALHLFKKHGWVGPELEPFSHVRAEPGETPRLCFACSSDLARYSVLDALIAVDAYPDAWAFIEETITPGAWGLQSWLMEPTRTKVDVLRAFVRAIERSKKQSGERR